jgi:hypothetical protein
MATDHLYLIQSNPLLVPGDGGGGGRTGLKCVGKKIGVDEMDAWGHVVAHHITCNAATCGYTYLYLFLPIGFPHWHVHVRALRSSSSAGSHSHPPSFLLPFLPTFHLPGSA